MPKRDPVGILRGLAFVAIFLLMLATFGQMSKVLQGPSHLPRQGTN
jgi:hypothetical protein